jgi:hypothetical protein
VGRRELPSWREPFERALDADPEVQRVRRDLADHLEERGDPDAEAVRWLADHDRRPFHQKHRRRWCWGLSKDLQFASHLPEVLWPLLTGAKVPDLAADCVYRSRWAAEADFCRAFQTAKEQGWEPKGEG